MPLEFWLVDLEHLGHLFHYKLGIPYDVDDIRPGFETPLYASYQRTIFGDVGRACTARPMTR